MRYKNGCNMDEIPNVPNEDEIETHTSTGNKIREGFDENGKFAKGHKLGVRLGHGQIVNEEKRREGMKRGWSQKNTRRQIFERFIDIKIRTQDGKEVNFFEAGIDFIRFIYFAKDSEVKKKGYEPLSTGDKARLFIKLIDELTIKESTLNINSEIPVIIHVDADDRSIL
jgi:hypothetical protein